MSLFNMAVKPHPFAPVLLMAINWAQPQDPNKKYPELGRMRYAWLSEDYKQVKLLLKDGPGSWTEKEWQDGMMNQIKGHEGFVDVKVSERDNCYLEATFDVVKDAGYQRILELEDFESEMKAADAEAVEAGIPSVTIGPWELFDRVLKDMEDGKITEEMKNLRESMDTVFGQAEADKKLEEHAKENGIEMRGTGPTIIELDSKGRIKNP